MAERHTIRTALTVTSLAALAAFAVKWLRGQTEESPFQAAAPVAPRYAPRGAEHALRTSEQIAQTTPDQASTGTSHPAAEEHSGDGPEATSGNASSGQDPDGPDADEEAPADDLTVIKGIGPVIERTLNSMGITRYAQIANFSEADINRVEEALGSFSGRIVRDEWVESARELANEQ
jgi:predicted flap endonuclease-1-like 5' DNA nuclease